MRRLLLAFATVSAILSININTAGIDCKYLSCTFFIMRSQYFYCCEVQIPIEITSPNQTVKSITGTHIKDYTNWKVTGLIFHNKTVNFVPHGIEKNYPNLRILIIESCRLKTIKKVDIEKLINLEVLLLKHNHLTTLDSDLFASNIKLQALSLKNNSIQTVGSDLLKQILKPLT